MLAGVAADETIEDTRPDEDEDELLEAHDDQTHRNFDSWVQHAAPGAKFPSAKNVASARRRQHHRLAVSRTPLVAPVGTSRESHYEGRLILAFPFFVPKAQSSHCPRPDKGSLNGRVCGSRHLRKTLGA